MCTSRLFINVRFLLKSILHNKSSMEVQFFGKNVNQLNFKVLVFCLNFFLTYCEKRSKETFEIRGWRPRICKIFEITRTIHSNSERLEQFLKQNAFLTHSWRFLRSNYLEQLEFKSEKNSWDVEKCRIFYHTLFFFTQIGLPWNPVICYGLYVNTRT